MARTSDDTAAKAVAQRSQAKKSSANEYYEREANLRPTPTQEEADLAKVGALKGAELEDDGSEWDDEAQRKAMEGRLPGGSPYDTRSLNAGGESTVRRGGRPKKAQASE